MTPVRTESADGVAVFTIDRPEARNAVNQEVAQQLAAAMDEFERRDDITIGIITGAAKSLAPVQGDQIAKFGLKLLYGATLVSFISATVVGLIS